MLKKDGTVSITGDLYASSLTLAEGLKIAEGNLELSDTLAKIEANTTLINSTKTEINSDITNINSSITSINSDILDINSNMVTFTDLSTKNSYTIINGDNITTGTLSVDRIKSNTSTNATINFTGNIECSNIKATGGSFGPLEITDDGLNSTDTGTGNKIKIGALWVDKIFGRSNHSTKQSIEFNADGGDLKGSWDYNYTEIAVVSDGSDKKIKHDIKPISQKYSNFFDSLEPVSFIYNKDVYGYGTSQRTHLGFIANDVEIAMNTNDITNQEFAGLVIEHRDDAEDGVLYRLKYNEFVALNTWQIQKAKARITELEIEVSNLQSLLREKGVI